jgi:hypothetical protein
MIASSFAFSAADIPRSMYCAMAGVIVSSISRIRTCGRSDCAASGTTMNRPMPSRRQAIAQARTRLIVREE